MKIKKLSVYIGILFLLCVTNTISYASIGSDGLGQTIQIYTRFHSFVGKPSWLIIIRDLDHNQNIPYVFDITRGNNFWLLFTYGRNYLITVSNLQINTYQPRYNTYGSYKIPNFCSLESNGRIIRGESLYITIEGNLTSDPSTVSCHVSSFADANFTIATPRISP